MRLKRFFHVGCGPVTNRLKPLTFASRMYLSALPLLHQTCLHEIIPVWRECDFAHDAIQLPIQGRLRDVDFLVPMTVPGAVVVDVSTFLNFSRDRVAAFAGEHSAEREVTFGELAITPSPEDFLHLVKQPMVNHRRVITLIQSSVPIELAGVELLFQHPFYLGSGNDSTAPGIRQTGLFGEAVKIIQRPVPLSIQFKQIVNDRRSVGVYFNLAGQSVSHVSNRDYTARITALLCFLALTLYHFFRQVVQVVFRHDDFDPMHQFGV
jgi:hypothetical protein